MKKILFVYLICSVFFGGMNSCKKDTPAPTAEFEFVVDGYYGYLYFHCNGCYNIFMGFW